MAANRISNLGLWAASAGAVICSAVAGALEILEENNQLNSLTVETWRPPLLVWAAGLLLLAWIISYRTRTGGGSGRDRGNRMAALPMPGLATIVLAASVALPVLSPPVRAWLEPAWPPNVSANAASIAVSVPTMDCSGCIHGIDAVLRRERGLEKAEFSLERRQVIIWYDPTRASTRSVLAVLRDQGYPAEIQK